MKKRESCEYTLYGDLDGMTVADLRAMLDSYPDDARIDVRSEYHHSGGTFSYPEYREYFVFKWEE